MLFFNEDFDKVTFIANQGYILVVHLDEIVLGNDNHFHEDDTDTIIHVRLLACCFKFEKCKVLKKILEELITVASVIIR